MKGYDSLKKKVKSRENSFYRCIYNVHKSMMRNNIPIPRSIGVFFFYERMMRHGVWNYIRNKMYYEPMFRSRCYRCGKNVRTDGPIPGIIGGGKIIIGDNVSIGNGGLWILTSNLYEEPLLSIGDNSSIGYRSGISVENKVRIGNNCHIAGETMIFDNNSHSVNYLDGRKLTKEDVSPIHIEDNVWIGMRTMIFKGVRIGKGATVAAGSIVTKDVEPNTLVGGCPAVYIKHVR